jgi:hypothetical protein
MICHILHKIGINWTFFKSKYIRMKQRERENFGRLEKDWNENNAY